MSSTHVLHDKSIKQHTFDHHFYPFQILKLLAIRLSILTFSQVCLCVCVCVGGGGEGMHSMVKNDKDCLVIMCQIQEFTIITLLFNLFCH